MNVSCQNIINMDRPWQGITDLKNAGFDRIFSSIYVKFPEAGDRAEEESFLRKYSPETVRERYEAIIEKCREYGIQISFLKAPVIPPKADRNTVLPMLEISLKQSLALCRRAKCRFLLIELPLQLVENSKGEKHIVHDYLTGIALEARKNGVMLLLKNQTRSIGGHLVRGFCSEPFEAAKWIDRLNDEFGDDTFGFCVDVGVCNICGNDIQNFIRILGNRIKTVILRDNDGHEEASMLPFTCVGAKTDWLGVIRGLRDISFDGELAVDFSSTCCSFSPMIRPTLYSLAQSTAAYFKWQIEIENSLKRYKEFVLFGAGNMCRNYMKCYGDKYPPLFTCDNNPKTWGTTFEGLKVKSPEALKSISEDCCVVICNIFYREIEKQLREMGIVNIGYFNDEYMPSFYFDRLAL